MHSRSKNPGKCVYLDNNATTRACDESKKAMMQWVQCTSNPSGSTQLSQIAARLLDRTKAHIDELLKLHGKYTIVFTSGATESNCMVIRSIADSWWKRVGTIPHFISGSSEHYSVLQCLTSLCDLKRAQLTLVDPNKNGVVDPAAVERAMQPNTALVTIMYANNETGACNPVSDIARVAHARAVPFHTDAVQMFGKHPIEMSRLGIDALSMSFHKLYGPMGVGLLIIKKSLVSGFHLEAQICGTQQEGLRGGTENMPGIAGAAAALVANFQHRVEKNKKLLEYRNSILDAIREHVPVLAFAEYRHQRAPGVRVVVFGPDDTDVNSHLPNTILLAVVNTLPVCNVKMKKILEQHGIIVSVGSACNTSSSKASHVLEAMHVPREVKRGVLRVSLGDENTVHDVKTFIRVFLTMIRGSDIYLTA